MVTKTSINPASQIDTLRDWPRVSAPFGKTVSTLYIDSSYLKLVTVSQKKVIQWAEVPLEPGLVIEGRIMSSGMMAEKILELLQTQGIRTRSLIVGFSGLHCLSKIIAVPAIKKSLLPEAIRREAERELPVPLDNYYLAWQILSQSDPEYRIFLIAYARSTVDSLIETLRKAGLKPGLLDLSPLAITRLMDRPTAIIVDLRLNDLDMVVLVDGIPELVRSLPFNSGISAFQKIGIIKEELERTFSFYNSRQPESASGTKLPLFLSGELLDDPGLLQSLKNEYGEDIRFVTAPLQYPADMVPAHYTVNIGLALKKISGNAGPALVNLNALPLNYRQATFSLSKMLTLNLAIGTAGLVLAMTLLVRNVNSQTESLRSDLQTYQKTLTQKQELQKSMTSAITGLEKNVNETNQKSAVYETAQTAFADNLEAVNSDLEIVINKIGPGMVLLSLKQSDSLLTVSGQARSQKEIVDYSRSLSESGLFSEVTITNLTLKTDTETDFTIILKVRG